MLSVFYQLSPFPEGKGFLSWDPGQSPRVGFPEWESLVFKNSEKGTSHGGIEA